MIIMVDYATQLKGQTDVKNNFNNDTDVFNNPLIFRERMRVWQQIERHHNTKGGDVELAVLIPYDTFLEPLYSTNNFDMTTTTAVYDSANQIFSLYSDANGNYKLLQSKTFIYELDRVINSVLFYVDARLADGSNGIEYIDIELYNGNEWIYLNNSSSLQLFEYTTADLDADLDADVGGTFSNLSTDGVTILFQNKLKFRITRNSSTPVYIYNINIKVT